MTLWGNRVPDLPPAPRLTPWEALLCVAIYAAVLTILVGGLITSGVLH
jgi:hypothetical protein